MAVRMVWQVSRCVDIPVIGVGGITRFQDAIEFFMAGASAIQVGTATLLEPTSCLKILSGIVDFMRENNYLKIADMWIKD